MLVDQLLGASLANIKDKVDINVYFVPTAEQTDIEALQNSLEALPGVAEVKFTSRDAALIEFRERHQNDELTLQALDELGENPLGASLAVRANETSQYASINQFLLEQQEQEDPQNPIIDRVNFSRNEAAIEKLSSIIGAVERTGLITMLVLVVAAVVITFNTIRLAIYTTREEISVMRLVGASNMFIRGPFMVQGVMYGVIAGVIAILILYPLLVWLGPATATFFQFNIFSYFVSNFAYIFMVVIGTGVALGLISSILAVSRYLRV